MEQTSKKDITGTYFKAQSLLNLKTAEAKRLNALIRHAAAQKPGENPEIWGWLISLLPDELQGKGTDVSYSEYAIYMALAMQAIGPSYVKGKTIAEAAAASCLKRQKIAAVETADNAEEMQVELRGLVKLLASKGEGFDYSRLAQDLFLWQIDRIKLARKWEREFIKKGEYK